MSKRRLDIVGAGRVGRTLARLWHEQAVFEIGTVANRSLESSEEAIAFIGSGTTTQMSMIDVLMISAADGALAECASFVAETAAVGPESMVFHCSGAISSRVLAPLREKGANVASMHPVKSFADASLAVKTFPGIFCGFEGDAMAVEFLMEQVRTIGGRPFAIDPSSKAIYHAGSVFSSNYLVSTIATGVDCLVRAGIEPDMALSILKPMATEALENLFHVGPVKALTGPIARGEAEVVEEQVLALSRWDIEISSAYAALGVLTTRLAQQQGRASEESIRRIKEVLLRLTLGEKDA